MTDAPTLIATADRLVCIAQEMRSEGFEMAPAEMENVAFVLRSRAAGGFWEGPL